ncbi:MAG: hypothetical protein GY763_15200 [Gammaproteobacteria bacterium]|nr:hypothetical protein [Gammaproteobacteria bacterium]
MPHYGEKNIIESKNRGYLPDFCNTDVFLRALLVVELIAIVFALVSYQSGSFYVHIALISVLMLWVGLCVAAILCWINRLGWLRTTVSTTVWSIGVTLLITLLITLLSVVLESTMRISNQSQGMAYLLVRNGAVAVILIGLALRYFYLEFESKLILEVQAQARLQALQARIRPHFLFNSMNTIASLTHDEPDLAEQSIENLSDLFRASLAAESSVSLQQELELTRSYIELESLRLGDRLQINWSVPSPTPELLLPALTLQPLVENAIYHGVEPIYEGGTIDIIVRSESTAIEIVITNPVLEDRSQQHHDGNQMAVDNIRERLHIAFGGEAAMQLSEVDELFTVTLTLPTNTGED